MSCIFTSRRQFLAGSAAFFAWAGTPKLARAEGRDPRFLTIVLRGALDGLATVAPVGDPDWISARGDLALSAGSKTPPLKLTDFYSLHPVDAEFASHVSRGTCDHRSRRVVVLSRPIALRRSGRA